MVTETNNEACAQLQLALERAQTDIGSWSKPPPDVALSSVCLFVCLFICLFVVVDDASITG